MLMSLLIIYSTASVVSLPVYLCSLALYVYRLTKSGDTYVLVIRVGSFESQAFWFLRYVLWAEPSLRAFSTARALRSARSRPTSGQLRLLLWLRLQAYVFSRLTSIPYLYIKHINF